MSRATGPPSRARAPSSTALSPRHLTGNAALLAQVFVDLNDDHVFKRFKLSELLTESKTVLYAPDFLLQVQSQQQLVNLLDFAVYIRNVSMFVLVLFYLRRASIALEFVEKDDSNSVTKITGPWKVIAHYALRSCCSRQASTHCVLAHCCHWRPRSSDRLPR